VLPRIAAWHIDKQVLTARDVINLYLHSGSDDWRAMGEGGQAFADAALEAQIAMAKALSPSKQPEPLDTDNLPSPQRPLPPFDPDEGGW